MLPLCNLAKQIDQCEVFPLRLRRESGNDIAEIRFVELCGFIDLAGEKAGVRQRLPTHGGLMNWEFKRRERSVTAHVSGRLVFNGSNLIVEAALMGHGLIWVPDDIVAEHVSAGRLVKVLDDWAITYPGYHLYYASRRASPALGLVVEALRLKDDS